jgi:hypothetical protein
MKTDYLQTLADMLADAIDDAKTQKRRVKTHLAGLNGYFDSTPIRGPWKPGRPGVKWHLYQASIRKHHQLTAEVTALAWALKQLSKAQTAR